MVKNWGKPGRRAPMGKGRGGLCQRDGSDESANGFVMVLGQECVLDGDTTAVEVWQVPYLYIFSQR